MAKKKTPTGDYEVGYAKTPVRTQFKKGQSGHPGGRRKGSRNYKTTLRKVMARMVEMTEQGKQHSVDLQEALFLGAVQDALKGDHKVRVDLLDRLERLPDEPDDDVEELSDEDQAMLDAALQRRRRDDGGGHE